MDNLSEDEEMKKNSQSALKKQSKISIKKIGIYYLYFSYYRTSVLIVLFLKIKRFPF